MTPPEFLLVSLGTCAGYYAKEYLKARGLPTEPLAIKVTGEMRLPARVGRFQLEVTAPELDAQHQAGLMRAMKACLIHNTLLNPPQIEIALNAHAGAPLAGTVA